MKRILFVVSILMFAILSCGKSNDGNASAEGKGKKYIIATDTSFPPFEYKENNEYVGIDIDLIKKIAETEGFEIELKPMDFGGIIAALQSGQIDGAIAGASITEERKNSVDFSEPYYDSGVVTVVNKSNTAIKSVDDLAGKNLAVKNGTEGAKYAEDKLKGKVNVRVYEDSVSMYKAVENNQADAAFEDLPVAGYTIKITPDSKLKIATDRLTSSSYGFMVKKGANQELLAKFNSGLKKLKENGEYNKIVEKYTGQK